MKQTAFFSTLVLASAVFVACDKDINSNDKPAKMEIKISASADTRATDYGFDTGDKIGIYVVNYKGGNPVALASIGNHVDNICFTYNGSWTAPEPIYWLDNSTHADFYLYYPYAQVQNVSAHPFTIATNQSTAASYTQSDFMTGKASDVTPTQDAIMLTAQHRMSRATIEVKPGNGFTTESLAKANIAVKINGVKCNTNINIATGAVSVAGEASSITPLLENGIYKAIIAPQSVAEGNLITITIDGRDFNLKKSFTFEPGKSHKFTVTASKTSSGVNVTIDGWKDNGEDNGGVAE